VSFWFAHDCFAAAINRTQKKRRVCVCVRQVLGDLDESDWPELHTFSDYGKIAFEPRRRMPLERLLGDLRFAGTHACDFVAVSASYGPKKRARAFACGCGSERVCVACVCGWMCARQVCVRARAFVSEKRTNEYKRVSERVNE
jgi:hypothetical protein